jgi:hypothetical protein
MHETMASCHLRTKILAFVIHHPKEDPTAGNSFVSQIRNANMLALKAVADHLGICEVPQHRLGAVQPFVSAQDVS